MKVIIKKEDGSTLLKSEDGQVLFKWSSVVVGERDVAAILRQLYQKAAMNIEVVEE